MSDEILGNQSMVPLYVDSRAGERMDAIMYRMLELGVFNPELVVSIEASVKAGYKGTGSLVAPFVTLEEARAVQKPGQPIIIAGWATIGPAKLDS